MSIKNLFPSDKAINRNIDGVVKISQNEQESSILQEVREYVVTNELLGHFRNFYFDFLEAYNRPTTKIGVWISGFFGSGKSHFLKMLSFLLSNREVDGKRTLDYFRDKLSGDSFVRADVEACCEKPTETILFNIDAESPANVDSPVLHTFAKVFYRMRGYCGDDLNIAQLEQELDKLGLLGEFVAAFNAKSFTPWQEARRTVFLYEGDAVDALIQVSRTSKEGALSLLQKDWKFSIDTLIKDIKRYVDSKPADYRLLFMVDEVGQYLGADVNRLLNLQTIVEQLGAQCQGKVWVVCTAQDALERVVANLPQQEHGRIQDRFPLRLALTSSSVEEVIQKRLLDKTDAANAELKELYRQKSPVLKNLFSFKEARSNMGGYTSEEQFTGLYPFVPYQFKLLQEALTRIREHSPASASKLSSGERSLLAGFQSAACHLMDEEIGVLVPFHLFYNKIHSALDSNVRLVVENAVKAAAEGSAIRPEDVDILRLLYLIRYVDFMPASLDNIVILMASHIDEDMVELRNKIQAGLDRLLKDHYIGLSKGCYNFLTDEERDVENEIRNTIVDHADVIESIRSRIQGDICSGLRYNRNGVSFATSYRVNNQTDTGRADLSLWFRTEQLSPMSMTADSKGCALFVLKDTGFYELFEKEKKLDLYQKRVANVSMSASKRGLVNLRLAEKNELYLQAKNALETAMREAVCYVNGTAVQLKGTAFNCVSSAMDSLFDCIYSDFELVNHHCRNAEEIQAMLRNLPMQLGEKPNESAATKVEQWLRRQPGKVTLKSIIEQFRRPAFGWSEADTTALVAMLAALTRIEIHKAGVRQLHTDKNFCATLLNKGNQSLLAISSHEQIAPKDIQRLRQFIEAYCKNVNSETDEEPFFSKLRATLSERKKYLDGLKRKPDFPGRQIVEDAYDLLLSLPLDGHDNQALLAAITKREDDLLDSAEDLELVEKFNTNQRPIYEDAKQVCLMLEDDPFWVSEHPDVTSAHAEICEILGLSAKRMYTRIKDLPSLCKTIKEKHDALLSEMQSGLRSAIQSDLKAVHAYAAKSPACQSISDNADAQYEKLLASVAKATRLCAKSSYVEESNKIRVAAVAKMEAALNPTPTPTPPQSPVSLPLHKFKPQKALRSTEDIEVYLSALRTKLTEELRNHANRGISLY